MIHHLNLWLMACEKHKPTWVILYTVSTYETNFSKCREILISHHLTENLHLSVCVKQQEVHLCENDGRMQLFFFSVCFLLVRLPVTATFVWGHFLTSGTMAVLCLVWLITITVNGNLYKLSGTLKVSHEHLNYFLYNTWTKVNTCLTVLKKKKRNILTKKKGGS